VATLPGAMRRVFIGGHAVSAANIGVTSSPTYAELCPPEAGSAPDRRFLAYNALNGANLVRTDVFQICETRVVVRQFLIGSAASARLIKLDMLALKGTERT
jgi:hypothetical protein